MTHAVKQKTIDLLHEGCSVARNEYIIHLYFHFERHIYVAIWGKPPEVL